MDELRPASVGGSFTLCEGAVGPLGSRHNLRVIQIKQIVPCAERKIGLAFAPLSAHAPAITARTVAFICDENAGRASRPITTGRSAVAPADYRSSISRCEASAERAHSDEVRQAWLNLAETYSTLLMLENIELAGPLISGKHVA